MPLGFHRTYTYRCLRKIVSTWKKVAGEQSARLGAQERPPVGVDVPRGRSAPAGGQDPPHGRFADAVSEPAQFTVDSAVPHAGFSRASRGTRSRISGLACGRPGRLGYVHLRLVTRVHPTAGQSACHEAERPGRGYLHPGRPPNRRDPQGARHPDRGRREPSSGIALRRIRLRPQSPGRRQGRTEPQGPDRGLPRRRGPSRPAGTRHRPVSRSRWSRRRPGVREAADARDHPVSRIDGNPGR